MPTERLETSLDNLHRALARLEEALARPHHDDLQIDGTIQRFEFTVELFWKTLRRALAEEHAPAETPRRALGAAWRAGWLTDDETLWTDMLDDRNATSHIYGETRARAVFGRIGRYARAMRAAHHVLTARFPASPDRGGSDPPGASEVREKRPRYRKTRKTAGKSTTTTLARGHSRGTTTTTKAKAKARAKAKR